ncbi:MAG: Zn-ribbon domain-containing OB-fold protein [Candidatus Bathyarchaeota archaeon]|nr:Zn-ribbon domain-containing OB-fold protein [Candidatus Bathyarchaeota archaeon]
MSGKEQFTIERLCQGLSQGKLLGGKCVKCRKIHFPPRPLCDKCFSDRFEQVEISPNGKLLTYTIIHIAPSQFQAMAPYAMGIVQMENGLKVPGMIRDVAADKIKIGMSLKIMFESCIPTSNWPQWPRYYFKPA